MELPKSWNGRAEGQRGLPAGSELQEKLGMGERNPRHSAKAQQGQCVCVSQGQA